MSHEGEPRLACGVVSSRLQPLRACREIQKHTTFRSRFKLLSITPPQWPAQDRRHVLGPCIPSAAAADRTPPSLFDHKGHIARAPETAEIIRVSATVQGENASNVPWRFLDEEPRTDRRLARRNDQIVHSEMYIRRGIAYRVQFKLVWSAPFQLSVGMGSAGLGHIRRPRGAVLSCSNRRSALSVRRRSDHGTVTAFRT